MGDKSWQRGTGAKASELRLLGNREHWALAQSGWPDGRSEQGPLVAVRGQGGGWKQDRERGQSLAPPSHSEDMVNNNK